MFEDDEPRKKTKREIGLPLETLSVEELKDYVSQLDAEKARVQAEIGKRGSVRDAAEALFRKQSD